MEEVFSQSNLLVSICLYLSVRDVMRLRRVATFLTDGVGLFWKSRAFAERTCQVFERLYPAVNAEFLRCMQLDHGVLSGGALLRVLEQGDADAVSKWQEANDVDVFYSAPDRPDDAEIVQRIQAAGDFELPNLPHRADRTHLAQLLLQSKGKFECQLQSVRIDHDRVRSQIGRGVHGDADPHFQVHCYNNLAWPMESLLKLRRDGDEFESQSDEVDIIGVDGPVLEFVSQYFDLGFCANTFSGLAGGLRLGRPREFLQRTSEYKPSAMDTRERIWARAHHRMNKYMDRGFRIMLGSLYWRYRYVFFLHTRLRCRQEWRRCRNKCKELDCLVKRKPGQERWDAVQWSYHKCFVRQGERLIKLDQLVREARCWMLNEGREPRRSNRLQKRRHLDMQTPADATACTIRKRMRLVTNPWHELEFAVPPEPTLELPDENTLRGWGRMNWI